MSWARYLCHCCTGLFSGIWCHKILTTGESSNDPSKSCTHVFFVQFVLQSNFNHQADKWKWPKKGFEVMLQTFWWFLWQRWCLFKGQSRQNLFFLVAWWYFTLIADTFPLTHLLRRAFSHHRESHIPFSLCFPTVCSSPGTCSCTPVTGQGPTKSSAIVAYTDVLPEYLNRCFWSVATVFFLETLKGV